MTGWQQISYILIPTASWLALFLLHFAIAPLAAFLLPPSSLKKLSRYFFYLAVLVLFIATGATLIAIYITFTAYSQNSIYWRFYCMLIGVTAVWFIPSGFTTYILPRSQSGSAWQRAFVSAWCFLSLWFVWVGALISRARSGEMRILIVYLFLFGPLFWGLNLGLAFLASKVRRRKCAASDNPP